MDHSATLKELFASAGDETGPDPATHESSSTPLRTPSKVSPTDGPRQTERTRDDRDRLQELFGRPSTDRPSCATGAPDNGDTWPQHNYNEAYQALARRRIRTRRPVIEEHTLWDITDLLEDEGAKDLEPAAPVEAVQPAPWPEPRGLDHQAIKDALEDPGLPAGDPGAWNPDHWLDALSQETPQAEATEAHLVRTLRGDSNPVRRHLFDTTDILQARDPATPLPASRPGESLSAQAPTAQKPRFRLLRPPALVMKLAGVALGLKIGVTAGFLAATLL